MTSPRLASVLLTLVLAGCGALVDQSGFRDNVRAVIDGGNYSSRALNALTYGDMTEAERNALNALRIDPHDPYALYVAGMVYQATGRYDLARQYYQALLANRPQATVTTLVQGAPQIRTLSDIAQANLMVVDRLTGRYVPRTVEQSGRMPDLSRLPGEPEFGTGPMPAGMPVPVAGAVEARPLGEADLAGAPVGASGAEINVTNRFQTLKRLQDEGLITPEEAARRRAVNLGALLPYSSPTPPAEGLTASAPYDGEVVTRLRELNRAEENRGISPAEHLAERQMILDALLPAHPHRLEMPQQPPRDVMAAAAAAGRVERLRAAGLISADEAARERAAINGTLDRQAAVRGPSNSLRRADAAPARAPARVGVILATAKSEDEARTAWDRIRAKYPTELAGLDATFPQVTSSGKGTRWRVLASPVQSRQAATKLCKQLRLYRQSCDVSG